MAQYKDQEGMRSPTKSKKVDPITSPPITSKSTQKNNTGSASASTQKADLSRVQLSMPEYMQRVQKNGFGYTMEDYVTEQLIKGGVALKKDKEFGKWLDNVQSYSEQLASDYDKRVNDFSFKSSFRDYKGDAQRKLSDLKQQGEKFREHYTRYSDAYREAISALQQGHEQPDPIGMIDSNLSYIDYANGQLDDEEKMWRGYKDEQDYNFKKTVSELDTPEKVQAQIDDYNNRIKAAESENLSFGDMLLRSKGLGAQQKNEVERLKNEQKQLIDYKNALEAQRNQQNIESGKLTSERIRAMRNITAGGSAAERASYYSGFYAPNAKERENWAKQEDARLSALEGQARAYEKKKAIENGQITEQSVRAQRDAVAAAIGLEQAKYDREYVTGQSTGAYDRLQALLYKDRELEKLENEIHYHNIPKAADFEEYAKKGAEIENPEYGKENGFNRPNNIVTFVRENADEIIESAKHEGADDYEQKYLYMDENEVKVYNYLLAKEGEQAAQNYINSITDELNYRQGVHEAEEIENMKSHVGKALAYGGTAIGSGLDQSWQGVRQKFSADQLPTSAVAYKSGRLKENMSEAGRLAYGTIENVAQNSPQILASLLVGNLAGAAGATAEVAGNLGKAAGSAYMYMSASGNAYGEALKKGYNRDQATLYGTLVGLSETTLENILGGMHGMTGVTTEALTEKADLIDNVLGRVAAKWGIEGLGEIEEEVLQNYLDPLFRYIIFSEDYEAPTLEENLETAFISFFSAGIMNTADYAEELTEPKRKALAEKKGMAEVGNLVRAKASDEGISDLIDEAMQKDHNSDIYKQAADLKEKMESGTVTDEEVGRFTLNAFNDDTPYAKNNTFELPTVNSKETMLPGSRTELARTAIECGVSVETQRRTERICDMLNLSHDDVIFYKGGVKGENGFRDTKTGKIHINAESGNPTAQLIAHEVTHGLESTDSYKSLKKLALDFADRTEIGGARASLKKIEDLYFAAHPELRGQESFSAESELVAKFVEEHLLTDEAMIREVVNTDVTLGTRILDWLNEVIARIKHSVDKDYNAQAATIKRARDMYKRALDEAQRRNTPAATQTAQNEKTDLTESGDLFDNYTDEEYAAELERRYKAGELSEEAYNIYKNDDTHSSPMSADEILNKTMGDVQFSLSNDTETLSIKEQMRAASERLAKMEPAADIVVPTNLTTTNSARQWAENLFENKGYQVERQGYGTIYYSRKDILGGMRYAKSAEERAALAAVPYVLKRGIEIGEHGNHKQRNKKTITFSAPVILNGTKGNMAVVVNKSGNHYYAHRIVAPNGEVFTFLENKNNTVSGRQRGVTENGSLANATETVFSNIISRSDENSNRKVSTKTDDRQYSFGGERAQTADLEALTRAKSMRESGVADDVILRETGWYVGADGKWRFEIDDSTMRYKQDDYEDYKKDPEYDEYLDLLNKFVLDGSGTQQDETRLNELKKKFSNETRKKIESGTATLKDILVHDELFEAYPQLEDVKVVFKNLPEDRNGQFTPDENTIYISRYIQDAPEDTLIHEVQHVLQGYEDFASGSSRDFWAQKDERNADELYMNTAGEIEARDVTDRRTLTPEERRNKMPNRGDENTVFADRDYSLSTEEKQDVTDNLRKLINSGADVTELRRYVSGIKGNEKAEMPRLKTYSEKEAEKIVNTAHRNKMGVEEYLRENWEQYDVGGEWSNIAKKAIELEEGQLRQYSVTDTEDIKALPSKTREYLKKAERDLRRELSDSLSVPYSEEHSFVAETVRDLSREYLENGTIPFNKIDELFENAYKKGLVVDSDFYDNNKEVKDFLRKTPVSISREDRANIADYNDFRRSSFGTLNITKDGTPVDVLYQELNERWGDMFPEDITHPAQQLERMLEVGKNIARSEMTLDEAYGSTAFKTDAREQFETAVRNFEEKLADVSRMKEEADRKAVERDIKKAAKDNEKATRERYKTEAKILLTETDRGIVNELLEGKKKVGDLSPLTQNLKGIADVYEARAAQQESKKKLSELKEKQVDLIRKGIEAEEERQIAANTSRFLDDITGDNQSAMKRERQADINDYWESLNAIANAISPSTNDADKVSARSEVVNKTAKEKAESAAHYIYRKMVDSGEAVSRIAKAVEDPHLYHFYNYARASTSAAINMIQNAQTDFNGNVVGKSLNDILDPIRNKGEEYYKKFQLYLLHMHNVDRMQRHNQANIDLTEALYQEFVETNPELMKYTPEDIRRMAYDDMSPYYFEAQEYLRLRDDAEKAKNTVNKPVFGYDITAKHSEIAAQELIKNNPEFKEVAEEFYNYIDNLMQYRIQCGLITQQDYEKLKQIYPHYVPTFRETVQEKSSMRKKNSRQVGKTIGKARGGTEKIVPLHKALAQQTMSVVREGGKNMFGQRLLNSGAERKANKLIYRVQEYKGDFNVDSFDADTDKLFTKTNTFIVRSEGKLWEMQVSPDVYEAVEALSPSSGENNVVVSVIRKGNDLFKSLVTGKNPTFLIRNLIRDQQDAWINSKDLSAFAANYPQALAEIAKNGEYWQKYQALGGVYSSIFDYKTGEIKESNKVAQYTTDKIEALNMAVEQAPRLAEFMATVKRYEKANNGVVTTEQLMESMYNAAEVTVNFGRSGTIGKYLNANFVPFLNPGIQGFDKMIRNVSETKGFKSWAKLAAKCALFGIAPRILAELLYRKEPDWDEIKERDKDIYYLFKVGDTTWLKIPKGRVLTLIGMAEDRVKKLFKDEDVDWGEVINTAKDQAAPANPLTNNILSAWNDTKLFDRDKPGTTWYGSDIESQRLRNYAPGDRYDASTDVVSKWLGKTFNLSPKKINYLLDQYTGVIGDVVLPLLTPKAEEGGVLNIFKSAFTVDSTYSNKLSGEFYNKSDELKYAKNSVDATGVDRIMSSYWNKQSSIVSEINEAIRETEADSELKDKDKLDINRANYELRNMAMRKALDNFDAYKKAAEKYYNGSSLEDEEDRIDEAYRNANRDIFGAEYALSIYNKKVYEAAKTLNEEENIDFDSFYDIYFEIKGIEESGYLGTNKKRDIIREQDLNDMQKISLYEHFVSKDHDDKIYDLADQGIKVDMYLNIENKYNEINNGEGKASEKAQEFAYWLGKQGLKIGQQKAVEESFKFFTHMPADSGKYGTLTAAGLSGDKAKAVTEELDQLKPENGKKQVASYQKWETITSSKLTADEQLKAIIATDSDNGYKFQVAYDYHIEPYDYAYVYAALRKVDKPSKNGKYGTYTNEEVKEAIDSFSSLSGIVLPGGKREVILSTDQKAVIWQILSGSKRALSNPYNTTVGQEVLNALSEQKKR